MPTKKKIDNKAEKKEPKKHVVMVVEDDRFLNKAYTDKLQREGFDVLVAIDGEEALQRLKEKLPDVILLDVIMPRMSGFDFLEAIQNNPTFKKVPVVIISNLGQEEDIIRGKQLGAVDYLVKTELSINDIAVKVLEIINKHKKK